nr:reverse transcriptase domain-containing protein [Tanacetum cinerariifolium]
MGVGKGTVCVMYVHFSVGNGTIVPPTMTTRSAGRPAVVSRGGGTGGRGGSGGGRIRGHFGNQGDGRINGQGGQVGGQGSEVNDGREAAVSISLEEFKILIREEFFLSNEMQKLKTELWNHAMVGAGHVSYTNRFHDLARLVPHLVTPEGKRIERNGSIKKNLEKRENRREPSKDRNVRDDNKRTRTGNAFATITNPVGRENTGIEPSDLGFSYEIEIASVQLVEIDK